MVGIRRAAAMYLATVYVGVLAWSHLPRNFDWFIQGDFLTLPDRAGFLQPFFGRVGMAYGDPRVFRRGVRKGAWNPGKESRVITTRGVLYVGISLLFNSNYAFTGHHVIITVSLHGFDLLVPVASTQSDSNGEWQKDSSQDRPEPVAFERTARLSLFLVRFGIAPRMRRNLFVGFRVCWHEHRVVVRVGQLAGESTARPRGTSSQSGRMLGNVAGDARCASNHALRSGSVSFGGGRRD